MARESKPDGNVDEPQPNGSGRGTSHSKGNARPVRPASKDPYNFPKVGLEECVKLAQAIEEKNAGKPMPANELVRAVGMHQPGDWRFLDLLRSANMFGIINGTGEKSVVELTALGSDIVAPSSPDQRTKALQQAFDKVDLFKKVAAYYSGKAFPDDEYFGNTLVREFQVPRERVPLFLKTFTTSLSYWSAFARGQRDQQPQVGSQSKASVDSGGSIVELKEIEISKSAKPREFLDTCFMLMPFGDWYDGYYVDVYAPAIKDAGFEPSRADNLFHSGSVVEQIWEEIRGAKVLVAEVTGKNANVFYELGLAHARGKPVVILTGNLDDVPFDLRHLRVVVYDVRDPFWGEKVKKALTTYLKNAKTDPIRSIPQPFRDLGDSESNSGVDEQLQTERA